MSPLILHCIFTIAVLAGVQTEGWMADKKGYKYQPNTKTYFQGPDVLNSKYHKPSNSRTVVLFSRTGKFLEISEKGRVKGAINPNSKGIFLELQTFGISYRRIKRSDSQLFVAINKYGKAYTQRTSHPDIETLFQEIIDGASIIFKNVKYGWLLSLKKNGKVKKAVKPVKQNGRFPRYTKFLTIFPEKIPLGVENETKRP